MDPYIVEATVTENGDVLVPAVPFGPGTKLTVTLEESDPMDHETFSQALRAHYERS